MEKTRKEADIYSYVIFLYTVIVFVNKLLEFFHVSLSFGAFELLIA